MVKMGGECPMADYDAWDMISGRVEGLRSTLFIISGLRYIIPTHLLLARSSFARGFPSFFLPAYQRLCGNGTAFGAWGLPQRFLPCLCETLSFSLFCAF
jgi:hypothetical protein